MIKIISAFIRREILIEKIYKFHLVMRIADGAVRIAIFYFIGKYLMSPDYFGYVFVGILFGRVIYFFVSAPVDFIKHEQHWGTIEPLVASPSDFTEIMFSSVVGKTAVLFLFEFAVYLAVGAAISGFSGAGKIAHIALSAVRFAPYLVVTAVIFCSLGVFAAALSLKLKRIEQALWFMVSALEIMSGVYFPTEKLPGIFYIRETAAILPTTGILETWRSLILYGRGFDFLRWTGYALLSAVCLWVSVIVFKRFFAASLKKGDILTY